MTRFHVVIAVVFDVVVATHLGSRVTCVNASVGPTTDLLPIGALS